MEKDIHVPAELLEEFRVAAIALKEIKATELDLRNRITDVLLEGADPGTHNFTFGEYICKAVKKLSYSFDKETLDQLMIDGQLSQEELDLIRWSPDLRIGDYKKAECDLEGIDEALIVKPSQPTLEIKLG
jgi:hypothetical protein